MYASQIAIEFAILMHKQALFSGTLSSGNIMFQDHGEYFHLLHRPNEILLDNVFMDTGHDIHSGNLFEYLNLSSFNII